MVWDNGAPGSMSPASQFCPGPGLQFITVPKSCFSVTLTRKMATEGQGWEPSARVGVLQVDGSWGQRAEEGNGER